MTALRMQFFSVALVILFGIWLTGFGKVHWLIYVPVVMFVFAGATGVCPGLWFWKKMGFK